MTAIIKTIKPATKTTSRKAAPKAQSDMLETAALKALRAQAVALLAKIDEALKTTDREDRVLAINGVVNLADEISNDGDVIVSDLDD